MWMLWGHPTQKQATFICSSTYQTNQTLDLLFRQILTKNIWGKHHHRPPHLLIQEEWFQFFSNHCIHWGIKAQAKQNRCCQKSPAMQHQFLRLRNLCRYFIPNLLLLLQRRAHEGSSQLFWNLHRNHTQITSDLKTQNFNDLSIATGLFFTTFTEDL